METEGFMKFTAAVAVVLISACMALAQQIKEPSKPLPATAHITCSIRRLPRNDLWND